MRAFKDVVLACLLSFFMIQQTFCEADVNSDQYETNKWTCACSTAGRGSLTFALPANCSSSCECSAGGGSGDNWICICASDGLPRVATANNDTSCFTACNCNYGNSMETHSSKKRISSKVILIIVLICVTLITLAFFGSVLCYIYRRDKRPIQRPLFSSDKGTSYNSATNLISRGSSVVEYKGYAGNSNVNIIGCIPMAPFLFKSKMQTLHGTIIQFSYSELEIATNRFSDSNLIGVGGSSRVYCGLLKDGRTVAIKRIRAQGGAELESIFLTEIDLIARLHHCHLVPLFGYCSEHQGRYAERLLVFEYMQNGNLRDCLDGAPGKYLDWSTRIAIALGAARGLEYLHEAAAPRILHRDIKSTNILLDENLRAKITDLGMAKHLHCDAAPSCSSSPARMQGTFGYFAPEYAIVGRASLKSDVFSFGVVLLELITGRQPIHKSSDKGEESLVIWATPRLQDSKRVISELPDPRLEGVFQVEEMQVMAYLAKECLLLDPDSRPTMREVVQILSTIAPDKSKRKNFAEHFIQSSNDQAMKSKDLHRSDKSTSILNKVEAEEIKQVILDNRPAQCPSPLNNEKRGQEEVDTIDSGEYLERLILLTSKARSSSTHDEEPVDLTEPRFESFHLPSIRSPGLTSISQT